LSSTAVAFPRLADVLGGALLLAQNTSESVAFDVTSTTGICAVSGSLRRMAACRKTRPSRHHDIEEDHRGLVLLREVDRLFASLARIARWPELFTTRAISSLSVCASSDYKNHCHWFLLILITGCSRHAQQAFQIIAGMHAVLRHKPIHCERSGTPAEHAVEHPVIR